MDEIRKSQWFPYLVAAQEAAEEGKKVLKHYYGQLSQVQEKELAGLVSEADKESERVIALRLKSRFPRSRFLGEETSYAAQDSKEVMRQQLSTDDELWVVDPLDGTTNYIHQFPVFCISIGLQKNKELVAALVDAPELNQQFVAVKGGGSYLNGKRLRVSQRGQLKDTLLATGFFADRIPDLEEQIQIFSRIVRKVRGVRRAGAAAYDLCMVAQGVFDAFWEKNLMPWDTAAGTLIVREAGGLVTNYHGEPFSLSMNSVIAATPQIHNQLLAEFSSAK